MNGRNDSGCFGHVLLYLGVIVTPVAISAILGLNEDILPAYAVCLLFGFIIGFPVGLNWFSKVKSDKIACALLVVTIAFFTISLLAIYIHVSGMELYDHPTPSSISQSNISTSVNKSSTNNNISTSTFYQRNYPMTWGYIKKHADDPYEYIEFYHDVWGDLQAYHGDGIVFDTLSMYERRLVNYPPADSCIYLSSLVASDYHSTKFCYSLLRSNVITYPLSYKRNYSPCSKCVKQ